jgi:WD40 repeat protein
MKLSHRPATVLALAAAATFAVAAPGAAAASPAAVHTASAVTARSTSVPGGTQVWLHRFGGPYISASASSVATNPSRTVVYVTGITTKKATGLRDEVTVAYDAATGKQLWKARYQGTGRHPRSGGTGVPAIAVSPDGATVYVAGDRARGTGHNDYLVLAYNAATGAQLWATSPFADASMAQYHPVAVSPDSKTVYVTGTQDFVGSAAFKSYVTVAMSAATGATVWDSQRATPPHVGHTLTSIAVSPDGSRVFIAGSSGIICLDPANGEQLWMLIFKQAYRRLHLSLAVSPDSSTLYVTGGSMAPGTVQHYWTAAIVAANGSKMWQATYHGPVTSSATGSTGIALSPDGSTVYVTGSAGQASGLNEYATIGYDAATGHQLWQATYSTPKVDDNAAGLAVSPDGSTVYVTGTSIAGYNTRADYATVAYNAGTGAQLWAARYAVTGAQNDAAGVVASGGNAIVTGTSGPYGGPDDFATVAYQG